MEVVFRFPSRALPPRLPPPVVSKFGLVDSFRMAFSDLGMIFNDLPTHDSSSE